MTQKIAGYATPKAIARRCLDKTCGNPIKAFALARRYVVGAAARQDACVAIASLALTSPNPSRADWWKGGRLK
jgi:hypothetical protein